MDQIDVEDQSNSHNLLGSTNEGDVEDQNNSQKPTPSTDDKPSTTDAPKNKDHFVYRVFIFAINTFVIILSLPIVIPYIIFSLCFTGTPDDPEKGIYEKVNSFESARKKLRRLGIATAVRLGYLALLWLLLNLCVPSLKRMKLFGSPLWKWSLFSVVVLLGHFCSRILTRVIVGQTAKFVNVRRRKEIQLFIVGLRSSFSTLVYFGLILTIWQVYFHEDDGLNPNPSIDKYGTWTLVSLLVRAALRVLKSAALLNWEANAIYKRFKERILIAGFHLFFLSIILDDFEQPSLDQRISLKELMEINGDKNMLRKHVTLVQVREVASRLMHLAELTLREDDATAEIVRKCEEKIQSDQRCWKDIEQGSYDSFASIFKKMCTPDAILLLNEVRAKHPAEGVTCEIVRKWMVDAHKNCLLVGYTLADAFAVVSVLDVVLTCCIVVVVILFWLLATGLAATNVLITIGSIFIALSFMFNDTCKAFFQGVIFSFVTHPFDIGDRCIIDGIEVEVKRIGILMMTCVKIGTEEKMLYPSSCVSTKLIINLESNPDPTDQIEMVFDPSTKSDQIEKVRKNIEEFIDSDTHHSYEKYHRVMVKEMGSSIMMRVRFKHILNAEDMTHTKCFEKKNRQRYELFIRIKKFLEDQHIQIHK